MYILSIALPNSEEFLCIRTRVAPSGHLREAEHAPVAVVPVEFSLLDLCFNCILRLVGKSHPYAESRRVEFAVCGAMRNGV